MTARLKLVLYWPNEKTEKSPVIHQCVTDGCDTTYTIKGMLIHNYIVLYRRYLAIQIQFSRTSIQFKVRGLTKKNVLPRRLLGFTT